jgi:exodeoxyribonuclease VII large subunit
MVAWSSSLGGEANHDRKLAWQPQSPDRTVSGNILSALSECGLRNRGEKAVVSASQWSRQTPGALGVPKWLTLSQLSRQIEALVRGEFRDAYLVVAEVASFRRPGPSACAFVDLIEQHQGSTIARMSCVIYPSAYQRICREFDRAGMMLPAAGMKVLAGARVQFHSTYGLQLNIESIDPSYILGERERRKRELITRLQRERLTGRNKACSFPLVPQHVAIISSRSAAGYGDFVGHLERNPSGWRFTHRLFDARVQGESAEASLVPAFRQVSRHAHLFDVLVLVRGGGGTTDLDCFDRYAVAYQIAQCPLPVITGIGHERDGTVADLVAHRSVETPTAAAKLLLAALQTYEERVNAAGQRLQAGARVTVNQEQLTLNQVASRLSLAVGERLREGQEEVDAAAHRLERVTQLYLGDGQRELESLSALCSHLPQQRLSACEREIALLQRELECRTIAFLEREKERQTRLADMVAVCDPQNVLQRGYSITLRNGVPVTDSDSLQPGDRIETRLYRGHITSTVEAG